MSALSRNIFMYRLIASVFFVLSLCGITCAQGVITGPAQVCAGEANTYSISNFSGFYSTKTVVVNGTGGGTNKTSTSATFTSSGSIRWDGYEYDPSYPGPTHTLIVETVTLNVTVITPGTIVVSGGSSTCPSTTVTLTASSGSAPSFSWQSSPAGQNTWSTFTTTAAASVTSPTLTQSTDFRRITTCASSNISNVVTVTIKQPPSAGSISGSATICSGSAPGTITSTQNPQPSGFNYTIQWQQSVNGGAWTDIASARGTNLFTYSPAAITQNTSFRRVALWDCDGGYSAISNAVDFAVTPVSATGTLSGSVSSVCASGAVQLTATNLVSTATQWQYRYSEDGGNNYSGWSTFSTGASPQSYTATSGALVDRIYQFQVVAQNGVCSAVTSNAVSIVARVNNGGVLSTSLVEAYGVSSGTFTVSSYIGTFQKWQVSTNGGGTWSDASGANTSPTYTYSNVTATRQHRGVIVNGACTNYSPAVTISISYLPSIVYAGTPAVAVGSSITLGSSKNVGNTDYYSYQWLKDGVTISGATQSTYVVKEPGKYQLRVQASATSTAATTGNFTVFAIGLQPDNINNTVVVTHLRKAGATNSTNLYATLQPGEVAQQIVFYDPLYRPFQQIAIGQSPAAHDVVVPVTYDSVSAIQYLPYVTSGRDGLLKPNALLNGTYTNSDQYLFYQQTGTKIASSTAPYAKSIRENSIHERVLQQGAPGVDWQPGSHTVNAELRTNAASDVRLWTAAGPSGYYAVNTLAVNKTIDEQGNATLLYTDRAGRQVLKRQQLDATIEGISTPFLETYFVYDQHNNLVLQVPPKASAKINAGATWNTTFRDQWCFVYTVDEQDRVVEKKTPDATWIYYVYDRLNRLVLTQDGNLRSQNKWNFVKYDSKGRVVINGLYTNATDNTRALMKTKVDALYANASDPWCEGRGTTLHGYSNASFPTLNQDNSALEILAVRYYDTYDFDYNGSDDYAYVVQGINGEGTPGSSFGLFTGTKQVIVGSNTWLYSYLFYDTFGRLLQARANNHLSATVDNLVTVGYDFEGRAVATKTYHNGGGTNQVTTLVKNTYTNGRLIKITQSVNGAADQTVAQYDYNEIGQMVDKKLHDTGASNFLQSVDYRYTIRGWLSSINNAQLANDGSTTNDDGNDFFGMELLYNTSDAGLGTTGLYNGLVSALKWKGAGPAAGTVDQGSYAFGYDKAARLLTTTYKENSGSAWTKEVNTLNENLTYDHNGNVLTLLRNQNQRGMSGLIVTSTAQAIDNLTYTYVAGNALSKVEDASANVLGFKNAVNTTTEYTYNTNGSLTKDDNKGITAIAYNALGKAQQIDFADGGRSVYTYDASGNKLTMKYYKPVGTLLTTTDYVNGFVYENSAMSFFASPEGKVVKNGGSWEYQYAIADHQGNTRVLFTSVMPAAQVVTATFETATQSTEMSNFGSSYPTGGNRSGLELYDHTDVSGTAYTYSQLLNGGNNSIVGLAKSYKVYPGDKVKIEAYAKYYNPQGTSSNVAAFATALTAAFGVSAGSTGDALLAYQGLNSYGAVVAGGGGNGNATYPKAFVNILLFDKNFKFIDIAYEQIDGGQQVGVTPKAAHDYLSREYTVKEAGYAYVFVSNENPTLVDVYFDDIQMTYTPTNLLQYNEYYPYGLQTANSWTRDNTKNNFLYNQGTELDTNSGLYETFFRGYDGALGRFHQVDPLADISGSKTPYHYASGNPVMLNDPLGAHDGDWSSYVHPALDGPGGGYAGPSGTSWEEFNDIINDIWYGSDFGGYWTPEGGTRYYQSEAEAFISGAEHKTENGYWDDGGGGFAGASKAFEKSTGIKMLAEVTVIDHGNGTYSGDPYNDSSWLQNRIDAMKQDPTEFDVINRKFMVSFYNQFAITSAYAPDIDDWTNEEAVAYLTGYMSFAWRYNLSDEEGSYPDLMPIGYEIIDDPDKGTATTTKYDIIPRSVWSAPFYENPGDINPATGIASPIWLPTKDGSVGLKVYFQFVPNM